MAISALLLSFYWPPDAWSFFLRTSVFERRDPNPHGQVFLTPGVGETPWGPSRRLLFSGASTLLTEHFWPSTFPLWAPWLLHGRLTTYGVQPSPVNSTQQCSMTQAPLSLGCRPTTTLFDSCTRMAHKWVRFLATPDIIPPVEDILPMGRGFSLISTGIEQNPGPYGPAAGNIGYWATLFLTRWQLTHFVHLEDDGPPDSGPDGGHVAPLRIWTHAVCLLW